MLRVRRRGATRTSSGMVPLHGLVLNSAVEICHRVFTDADLLALVAIADGPDPLDAVLGRLVLVDYQCSVLQLV